MSEWKVKSVKVRFQMRIWNIFFA